MVNASLRACYELPRVDQSSRSREKILTPRLSMNKNTKSYWFPAKRYGWGWGLPATWQGWGVFIIYIAVISILPFLINPNENLLLFLAAMIGCTGILIGVCYMKGEPPKWRWGNAKNTEQSAPE